MPLEVEYDVVEGADLTKTPAGLEITRPALVKGLTGDTSTAFQNPAILVEALAALPVQYVPHPSMPQALLEDYRIHSVRSADSVIVGLVYKQKVLDDGNHATSSNWSLTDATQGSYVTTYSTPDGNTQLTVWYLPAKKGGKLGVPAGEHHPAKAGAAVHVVGALQYRAHRILTATAVLRGADWDTWKKQVRAASGKINADQWGEEARGTWMFLGPTTRYVDPRRKVVHVQLNFMHNPYGFYALLAYLNERGKHPPDCDQEATVRKLGLFGPDVPPDVNKIRSVNGLTLASVQFEAQFGPIFAFTPDT